MKRPYPGLISETPDGFFLDGEWVQTGSQKNFKFQTPNFRKASSAKLQGPKSAVPESTLGSPRSTAQKGWRAEVAAVLFFSDAGRSVETAGRIVGLMDDG